MVELLAFIAGFAAGVAGVLGVILVDEVIVEGSDIRRHTSFLFAKVSLLFPISALQLSGCDFIARIIGLFAHSCLLKHCSLMAIRCGAARHAAAALIVGIAFALGGSGRRTAFAELDIAMAGTLICDVTLAVRIEIGRAVLALVHVNVLTALARTLLLGRALFHVVFWIDGHCSSNAGRSNMSATGGSAV
jgi:hypothetical protein